MLTEIASALTLIEILKDWQWLADHLFRVVNEMENEEEVTNFTICKINSLITHSAQPVAEEINNSGSFRVVAAKFRERFPSMPEDERLVNYYACK